MNYFNRLSIELFCYWWISKNSHSANLSKIKKKFKPSLISDAEVVSVVAYKNKIGKYWVVSLSIKVKKYNNFAYSKSLSLVPSHKHINSGDRVQIKYLSDSMNAIVVL